MRKRKICIVTCSRSEFGLLTPLISKISNDETLDLQLIVSGTHLSSEFSLTSGYIDKIFSIDKKIEMVLSSDTAIGISKSIGLGFISFSEAFAELLPDIVVVLGDRYELLSIVGSALIARLPVAHISGGEVTEGAIDDSIRHAITKMSHVHFPATDEYKQRILQLGERPELVFTSGEPGLDGIKDIHFLSKNEFEEKIKLSLKKHTILVTFHPETVVNHDYNDKYIRLILSVLDCLQETSFIFTQSNSDTGGRLIDECILEFVNNHPDKAVFYPTLGQSLYYTALRYVDIVLGNSSSGIVEAPSFNVATINIGDRQLGRIRASSVIDVNYDKRSILDAISEVYTDTFRDNLKKTNNPYYKNNSSVKIKKILKTIDLTNILRKKFIDIDVA